MSNGVNCSERLHRLGNKNRMTDYNLQCINCKSNHNINLMAHRNKEECITGFIAVCNNCLGLTEKLNQTIEMVIRTNDPNEHSKTKR